MSLYSMLRRYGFREDIARAFEEVPRRFFAHESEPDYRVESDVAIFTFRKGEKYSTSSQPSLMAQFMEWVKLEKGMKVLEIGGGTGYNAAVMSRIVGDEGLVVSIEYDEEIFSKGVENLMKLGIKNVIFINSDGYMGCKKYAPYDAIICTVGVDEIPTSWVLQLKDRGKIIAPLNLQSRALYQPAFLFEKKGNWVELEYKTATGFLKAEGMLGNLNERNLERLKKVENIPETDKVHTTRSGLDVMEVLTASVANDRGRFYLVEDEGYSVWRRYYWEIHGKAEVFSNVYSLLEEIDFAPVESKKLAYRIDRREFKKIEKVEGD